VGSGKWEVGSGKWEVGSGKWEVGSGKWEVGSGKLTRPRSSAIEGASHFPPPKLSEKKANQPTNQPTSQPTLHSISTCIRKRTTTKSNLNTKNRGLESSHAGNGDLHCSKMEIKKLERTRLFLVIPSTFLISLSLSNRYSSFEYSR